MKILFFLLLIVISFDAVSDEKQLTADKTGIDPTEIIGRIEFNYTYVEKEVGTLRHSGVFRFDRDINESTIVKMEVPVATAEIVNGGSESGLGDVGFSLAHRFYHSDFFSSMVGGSITLDTASDSALGESANSLTLGTFNSWRPKPWLYAAIMFAKFSEETDDNRFTFAPLIGYQPMMEYLSYVTVGPSASHYWNRNDTAFGTVVSLGKVMKNGDIYSFGSRFSLDGESDDKTVLTLGYRRLF